MKILLFLFIAAQTFLSNANASMCEVKNFDEFFAKNLDILVPSDSDNTPNSIRIKKSLFHYFIIGRDLPVEVIKDGKVINLHDKELGKYIWGIERRQPNRYQLNANNCLAIEELEKVEKYFIGWRKENLSLLANGIHELDFRKIVEAMYLKKIFNKDGELDLRSIRTLDRIRLAENLTKVFPEKFKLSKKSEAFLFELIIETDNRQLTDNRELLDLILKNGADINSKLFNGLSPSGYAALLGNMDVLGQLIKNGASLFDLDSFGNSNGLYVLLQDSSGDFEVSRSYPNKSFLNDKKNTGKFIFNSLPAGLNWRQYYQYRQIYTYFKDNKIDVPDQIIKDFDTQPTVKEARELSAQLDEKRSKDDPLNDRLTDKELAWRIFASVAYPSSSIWLPGDVQNKIQKDDLAKYNERRNKLSSVELVENPRTGKEICPSEIFEELIFKHGLFFYNKIPPCRDWPQERQTVYSRLIKHNKIIDYFSQANFFIPQNVPSNEIEFFWKSFKYSNQLVESILIRNLSQYKIRGNIQEIERLYKFSLDNNLVKNLYLNLWDGDSRPRLETILLAYREDGIKWSTLSQDTKLLVLMMLRVFPETLIASKPLLISSERVNFLNGYKYYLCGRYDGVMGFDISGKNELLNFPFCLHNEESLIDDTLEAQTNLIYGKVYNWDNDRLAILVETPTSDYYSQSSNSLYDYLVGEYVLPPEIEKANLIFVKRDQITSPTVLTDGIITLALQGFHVGKVTIAENYLDYNRHIGPCAGVETGHSARVIVDQTKNRDWSLDRSRVPRNFQVSKARVLNFLPINIPEPDACNHH